VEQVFYKIKLKNDTMINLLSRSPQKIAAAIYFLFLFPIMSAQNQSNSVFDAHRGGNITWLSYSNNHKLLYNIISDEAFQILEIRKEKIASLQTPDDWFQYRTRLKEKLFNGLAGFEKSPLNVKVTGTIKRETFYVEKILFESHPQFYVTGCLFIPKVRQKPAPAIIYCSGHGEIAFRGEEYQLGILNLVAKGFIVFAFDPIGQGERLQYLDPVTNKSSIGGPTMEHTYMGSQCLLAGHSLLDYFIWDGVRVVDFLLTRKEVDASRIGITGMSGGGTQTSLIAAYDDRIYASAPECFITNFTRLLESIGPQDAEQIPYSGIKKGIDHPDFLHLRAPKPTLIVTATNDFFSIQGARETFSEVQKSFTILGKPENISTVEDMSEHGPTLKNREAICQFFQKYLLLPGDKNFVKGDIFDEKDLWVTETGQVATSLNGKTVFDLNKEYINKIHDKKIDSTDLLQTIRQVSGIEFKDSVKSVVYTGKIEQAGITIEKYFIQTHSKDYVLPFYLAKKSSKEKLAAILYLSPGGKEDILNSEEVLKLLQLGYAVISPDLPGTGELNDPDYNGVSINGVLYNYMLGANFVGKSIAGYQAEALDLLMQHLQKRNDLLSDNISAVVRDEMCSAFLHLTAFKNLFKQVVLIRPYLSYLDIATTRYYQPRIMISTVPGALNYYDLPDLEALLFPKPLTIINPVYSDGKYVNNNNINELFLKVKNVYTKVNPGKFNVSLIDEKMMPAELVKLF
jgi:cephalosporin-C deacetylase-like acetyl esterase